ncbi:MAG: HEAT repeat domain-containing protein [Phycisphaerales bacterium]|nr:HEAT repeat domain-containing protein [Phycisphaerales bacterium]
MPPLPRPHCPPPDPSRRRSRVARCAAVAPALLLVALAGGCSDGQVDQAFRRVFEFRRTPQQYALIAFSDADPDVRRDALTRLARSSQFDRDWAVQGYVTIALLESNDQTRCIAVRALARCHDPRSVSTLLMLLNHEQHPPESVRPPTDIVRWDAALGLAELCEQGHVEAADADAVRNTFIARLKGDADYHVRTAAARGLAAFPGDETILALIAALRDERFAVAYAAEDSLARLTGVTHGCSALRWEQWLAEHPADRLSGDGQLPAGRQPPYRNRWEKAMWTTGQMYRALFPGRKE